MPRTTLRAGAAVATGVALVAGMLASAPTAGAAPTLATNLVAATNGVSANRHLIALQRIADQNGGTRAVGTPGYEASVNYVANTLKQLDFKVSFHTFEYEQITERAASFTVDDDPVEILPMTYTPSTPEGGITAPVVVVPVAGDATPGCEAADYAALDLTGDIALIRRGGCSFAQKSATAAAEGAIAAVIANNVPGALNGTLSEIGTTPIATVGISQADGDALVAAGGGTGSLEVLVDYTTESARNVIAQTRTGRTDNVVMLGSHLDSVPEGPGINDNGTGSAGLLEVASKLGSRPAAPNAVRFAWWGAEELGLVGSNAYVADLSFARRLDIALYLNFDMIGSPNAAYFVYDGDDSDKVGAGAGPYGSAALERTLANFLKQQRGVTTLGTDFDGRSDYGAFIAAGIPASGIFTGAEGIKTVKQASIWGGRAGVAYDPCYHQACDNLGNVDRVAFDRNVDAIAHAVGTYASSTRVINGVPSRTERSAAVKPAPVAKPAGAPTA